MKSTPRTVPSSSVWRSNVVGFDVSSPTVQQGPRRRAGCDVPPAPGEELAVRCEQEHQREAGDRELATKQRREPPETPARLLEPGPPSWTTQML